MRRPSFLACVSARLRLCRHGPGTWHARSMTMGTTTSHAGTFAATDTAGRTHMVLVFKSVHEAFDGSRHELGTMVRTAGGVVLRVAKGRYEMPGLPPVLLATSEPGAP